MARLSVASGTRRPRRRADYRSLEAATKTPVPKATIPAEVLRDREQALREARALYEADLRRLLAGSLGMRLNLP